MEISLKLGCNLHHSLFYWLAAKLAKASNSPLLPSQSTILTVLDKKHHSQITQALSKQRVFFSLRQSLLNKVDSYWCAACRTNLSQILRMIALFLPCDAWRWNAVCRGLQPDYATTMKGLISHHFVLSRRTQAGSYYHYSLLWFVSSGSSANSNNPSHESSSGWKILCIVMVSKWHSKDCHSNNTFLAPLWTTVALRYTVLCHRDALAADDGSRKHRTILEHRPHRNNEVNDVTMQGEFDRCRQEMRSK